MMSASWQRKVMVTADKVRLYCTTSGEHNTIHTDPRAAETIGLKAPIVPGLLITILTEEFLAALHGPRLTGFSLRFVRPMYVGDELAIDVRVVSRNGRGAKLRVMARNGDSEIIAVGAADVNSSSR